jgi:ATP-dependent Clp protease adapter protein ClpS
MSKTTVKPRTAVKTKTQRPPLYKVILLNDDYTPREFVVLDQVCHEQNYRQAPHRGQNQNAAAAAL